MSEHGSIVRDNLMIRPGYAPYCGGGCREMPRTKWDGEQFKCGCGWRSEFPADFISLYRRKWRLTETV